MYASGELRTRAEKARAMMETCCLCPRCCRVNRLSVETGQCRSAGQVVISSYGPHFGEESPLVGRYGSGTIFFTNCNLRCIFCQNYTISQLGEGTHVNNEALARMMLSLQEKGCHNINLVSPTHVVPYILDALDVAAGQGLNLPLVYNSGGYDSLDTLKMLDGIVAIYMPDMKYSDSRTGERLSGVKDYAEINRTAVKEMHRQVGDLQIDENGIARRGLLVRHLVLPNGLAGTDKTMSFLAREVSPETYVNIMAQYRPHYLAATMPEISRPANAREFREAINLARHYGIHRLDKDYALPPLASW
ncbi:MAG TPA: radical SAM protein [Dehalococcoidia bacterium]|nr:radical SAM protein [Dehalococcoidia bacterium]